MRHKLRICMVEWEICSAIADASVVLVCVFIATRNMNIIRDQSKKSAAGIRSCDIGSLTHT